MPLSLPVGDLYNRPLNPVTPYLDAEEDPVEVNFLTLTIYE